MRLSPSARARVLALLDAVVPGAAAGDPGPFFDHLERDGAPALVPGLLGMVAAVEALARWRTGRRLRDLSVAERDAFLGALETDPSPALRAVLGSLKVLGGFARFDRDVEAEP